jgi:hypothetical protein
MTNSPSDVVHAVWCEVLGVELLDPDVGFFDLGATSSDVMSAVTRLRDRWPDLRAVDMMLYPTVNSLATFLADPQRA